MSQHWVDDYEESRGRFRDLAGQRGLAVSSLEVEARGPAGEPLTVEATYLGTPEPRAVVVHLSGVHGVEGFLGGAIQHSLLSEPPRLADDQALILIHGVNPYGMAWLRRVNENNVDLNRNCLEPGKSYSGVPDDYQRLDPWLNPPTPPAAVDDFYPRALWYLARYGRPRMRQAIAGGQYELPRGIFYGGDRLQASLQRIQEWLEPRLATVKSLVCIDVHSGLGPYGRESLLVPYSMDSPECREMTRYFGSAVSGSAESHYRIDGAVYDLVARLAPEATTRMVVQELGTYSTVYMLNMLRQENRWWWHGDRDNLRHPIKKRFLRAFSPIDNHWRSSVLHQGHRLVWDAVEFVSTPRRTERTSTK